MAKIKGDDLIVMIKDNNAWKAIAFSTSCEIDINAEIIQAGNPASGRWPKKKLRLLSWNISSSHLLSDREGSQAILSHLTSGQEVEIIFSTVEAHKLPQTDPPSYTPNSKFQLTGKALISRYTVTAKHRDFVTASISFEGSGENNQLNTVSYGED